jgi:predicted nucleic acid-binding protein
VARLRSCMSSAPLLVGDLILCEILRGFHSEAEARVVERGFRRFEVVSLCDPALAIKAAANYRYLRARGITVRKLADLIIGTFCIERGHDLLHSDRDFEPMERLLGLRTV